MAVGVARPSAGPRPIPPWSLGDLTKCPFPTVTAAFYHQVSIAAGSSRNASGPTSSTSLPSTTSSPHIAVRDLSGPTARELTYPQLAAQAQILAARLRSLGVQPRQRIPLVVRRGLEMVVGIWAILSCGAQYVPLDGGVVPDSTIRHVVEQSAAGVVVCLSATEKRVRSQCPHLKALVVIDEWKGTVTDQDAVAAARAATATANPGAGSWLDMATSDSGCYVIYTSGTTGKPKGVDVTHRNVANLVCQAPGNLGISAGTRVGQVLNISFDMAAWEVFACLCNGGTLVVRGSQWEPTIQQIDVLICTPSILSRFQPSLFPNIKVIATAGEPTSQTLADLWAASGVSYWNCCGPTETTIVNTMALHQAGEVVTIGRPTPNNRVYVVDEESGELVVEPGVAGVMWAGGLGVSRGYVGGAGAASGAYAPDRFAGDGSLMYNTGDLGRWRPDGTIDILGRCDDQVKVKGFRVELDGVSASLASAPGVLRATALLDGELHGFVVAPSSKDPSAILAHAGKLQPYYAVPGRLHQLAEFPTTANGKIDKRMLMRVVVTEQQLQQQQQQQPEIINEKEAAQKEASVAIRPCTPSTYPLPPPVPDSPSEKRPPISPTKSDCGTLVETQSVSSTTTTLGPGSGTASEPSPACLELALPDKHWPQPLRGLRLRILIAYRFLFGLVGLTNVAAVIAIAATRADSTWLSLLTAANLTAAVLVRQDVVINTLYTICCSVPKGAPLWLRARCAKIYHLGGVHSGAGVCATAWLLAGTLRSTITYAQAESGLGSDPGSTSGLRPGSGSGPASPTPIDSLATIVVSWLLSALCCAIVGFAWPAFRRRHHNLFERLHRFLGWTALLLFWVRTLLSIRDANPAPAPFGPALARSPGFWLLAVATCSVASSWFFLRRVPVDAVPLSDHAVELRFKYTLPVNGSFTRLSLRPLLEWHSFATIPTPTPSPSSEIIQSSTSTTSADSAASKAGGYSLVVSNAGDWTHACIRNPPTRIWVRGLPTCGVMRIATLFNRIVVIATGSGIGPLLGHIARPSCPTQLIWSTPHPEQTFGKAFLATIRRSIPDAVIHDTRTKGRPDLVKMGYNLAADFGAEAVIIIANEKITKKVVYGLESRGLRAYGAIWDS